MMDMCFLNGGGSAASGRRCCATRGSSARRDKEARWRGGTNSLASARIQECLAPEGPRSKVKGASPFTSTMRRGLFMCESIDHPPFNITQGLAIQARMSIYVRIVRDGSYILVSFVKHLFSNAIKVSKIDSNN